MVGIQAASYARARTDGSTTPVMRQTATPASIMRSFRPSMRVQERCFAKHPVAWPKPAPRKVLEAFAVLQAPIAQRVSAFRRRFPARQRTESFQDVSTEKHVRQSTTALNRKLATRRDFVVRVTARSRFRLPESLGVTPVLLAVQPKRRLDPPAMVLTNIANPFQAFARQFSHGVEGNDARPIARTIYN